jgi:hypothetical protein
VFLLLLVGTTSIFRAGLLNDIRELVVFVNLLHSWFGLTLNPLQPRAAIALAVAQERETGQQIFNHL